MYALFYANKRVEKILRTHIHARSDIMLKLDRLREHPRKSLGAHKLHGKLFGKWSAWLGSNIRIVYIIDDANNILWVETVGSHKVY